VVLVAIVHTSTAFRCLAELLVHFRIVFALNFTKTPSHSTIRRWVNQVGYYKLVRPKELADDWIYIVDNSVRQSDTKVCLILGIRRSALLEGQCLTFSQMEVIGLHIFKANSQLVGFLEEAMTKTGIPLQICSDEGPDVMPSIKKIQQKYPTIQHVPDATHKVSNLLKKSLEGRKKWNQFVTQLTQTKNRTKQSKIHYLSPPNIRGKSRFMNAYPVLEWAMKTIKMIQELKPDDPNRDEILDKLGWLIASRRSIERFMELFSLAEIAKEHFREKHVSRDSWCYLRVSLAQHSKSQAGKTFSQHLVDWAQLQSAKAPEGMLLGCSEIIESAYGKLKALDRECGNSGFTSSVLGLAACFGETDFSTVQAAFEFCGQADVRKWARVHVGPTCLTQRRARLKSRKRQRFNPKFTRTHCRKS